MRKRRRMKELRRRKTRMMRRGNGQGAAWAKESGVNGVLYLILKLIAFTGLLFKRVFQQNNIPAKHIYWISLLKFVQTISKYFSNCSIGATLMDARERARNSVFYTSGAQILEGALFYLHLVRLVNIRQYFLFWSYSCVQWGVAFLNNPCFLPTWKHRNCCSNVLWANPRRNFESHPLPLFLISFILPQSNFLGQTRISLYHIIIDVLL